MFRRVVCVYCVESWWNLLGTEYLLRLVQVGATGVLLAFILQVGVNRHVSQSFVQVGVTGVVFAVGFDS